MNAEHDPVAHLQAAIKMAKTINDKVDTLLAPLDNEMRLMRWKPEFQTIMWEAVQHAAMARMEKLS